MSRKIFKYEVRLNDEIHIDTHEDAQLLTVQDQRGVLCFWFMVDTNEPTFKRHFNVLGTGHPVPPDTGKYISTVQQQDGFLVWHIFEKV